MSLPNFREPGNYVLFVLGLLLWAIIVRIGWELGGVIWRLIP